MYRFLVLALILYRPVGLLYRPVDRLCGLGVVFVPRILKRLANFGTLRKILG